MAEGGSTLSAMSILDEIKQSFAEGSVTIKLIYANIAVFVLVVLSEFVCKVLGLQAMLLVEWIIMPTSLEQFIFRPWTALSYMFVHQDFIHIFFNLMCLYCFGRLVEQFLGEHIVMRVYLIGGLAGAAMCLLWDALWPLHSSMLGASAAILAL